MKRYLAFCGSIFYPSGGMQDCIGSFDTLEEAKSAIINEYADYEFVLNGMSTYKHCKDIYSCFAYVFDLEQNKLIQGMTVEMFNDEYSNFSYAYTYGYAVFIKCLHREPKPHYFPPKDDE